MSIISELVDHGAEILTPTMLSKICGWGIWTLKGPYMVSCFLRLHDFAESKQCFNLDFHVTELDQSVNVVR